MNNITESDHGSCIQRGIDNDAARKGAAGLLAGVLVAVISEALWPRKL